MYIYYLLPTILPINISLQITMQYQLKKDISEMTPDGR